MITTSRMKTAVIACLMIAVSAECWAGNPVKAKTITYEVEQPGATSSVSVDFPLCPNSPMRRAILDFIAKGLQSYSQAMGQELKNTCDESTFNTILSQYAENLCQMTADEQTEYAKSMKEQGEDYDVVWYANNAVSKIAETDLYVSYVNRTGEFMGGAHYLDGSTSVTIRKSDGKVVEHILKDGAEQQMQALLWKYLIKTQAPDDDGGYRTDVENYLEMNFGRRDYLPLPESITLDPRGVRLMYQHYDICPWALGAPEFIIPYSEAAPFLTKEADKLVKKR